MDDPFAADECGHELRAEFDTPSRTLDLLRQREAEALARTEVRRAQEGPTQLFLPGIDEFMRAMPNHIARSSLFAPVARGRKKIHKDTVLISRADAVIKFWGEQLDEAQADVWMQAMHEASKHPLGAPVIVKRAGFLRSIGRHVGNYEYKWLLRTMEALTFAMLVIDVTKDGRPKYEIGKKRALHLIDGFDYDEEAESYTLRVDPRWRLMFENREFALIDWDKRLRFGPRQDMAKALQRLVATSNDSVQRNPLEWLKRKLEYTGRMRDFVDALERAMDELERLDIIVGGRIETSTKGRPQTVWTRL
ncbi:plasmid-related transcriptional repressor protein [Burkholderia cenocepacia]|uniref:plasmid-related transcriptional repressor protein n=1 Tax=Burkholderia TaxID=32008 RepID=UPI001EEF8A5D|nr:MULTISPECIES: plasmid-related transcriptional repressor protein [Burkholderia]MCF1367094.1 plasmid-related transcriptional repressor protein [Burkholderia cenocepacia]MCF1384627.1 plasmid-related transcriptional repressor protein [Burkholderia cenocepacia]